MEDTEKLERLLQQNYRVTSVHRESTGTFAIRMVYAGNATGDQERYVSVLTRDEETANHAAELILQAEK